MHAFPPMFLAALVALAATACDRRDDAAPDPATGASLPTDARMATPEPAVEPDPVPEPARPATPGCEDPEIARNDPACLAPAEDASRGDTRPVQPTPTQPAPETPPVR